MDGNGTSNKQMKMKKNGNIYKNAIEIKWDTPRRRHIQWINQWEMIKYKEYNNENMI